MSETAPAPAGKSPSAQPQLDAVIVGAGFAGLYMLYRLRKFGFSARVYETGSDVGGTWFWNRYPGARVDIESMQYSYSFDEQLQQEWHWTERYASQPELLRYINHVADRFDLRRDVRLNTRVVSAVFDEKKNLWDVTTQQGERVTARFCIMATGCLSSAKQPDFPGLRDYQGKTYMTSRWPEGGVDFTGQRVGIIGTGSSGIQSIPVIAAQAAHLTVFQRTPNFSVPAHNGPIDPEHERTTKANYAAFRHRMRNSKIGHLGHMYPINEKSGLEVSPEEREHAYEVQWQHGGFGILDAFTDVLTNKEVNDTVADFARRKIRSIVRNPEVAEMLCPKDYPFGTKRLCVDSHYYDTYNRDNVTLVDIRKDPIERFTATGIKTQHAEFEFDAVVFAIGFDAMTGALFNVDIRGRAGATLKDKWHEGPRTYLGVACAGFPNFFMITGPGSPSVLTNMVGSIEQHVEWISDCMAYLRDRDLEWLEPTTPAEEAWVKHVEEVGNTTLYPLANSWYVGANVPGKPRVFMPYVGGFNRYWELCEDIATKDYEGFVTGCGSDGVA